MKITVQNEAGENTGRVAVKVRGYDPERGLTATRQRIVLSAGEMGSFSLYDGDTIEIAEVLEIRC